MSLSYFSQPSPVTTSYDDFYDVNEINNSSYSDIYQNVLDYQKHIEEREDSAYQRMVADMKAAGLNPWTGIASGGSSASSSNASSEALKALMTGLEYNLKVRDNEFKQDSLIANTLTKVLGLFTNFAKMF